MAPFFDATGRATFRDLWSFFGDPNPEPDPLDTVEELADEIEALGLKFRDFRGWKRDKKYPSKPYGYSRTGGLNRKQGRAHGTLPWEKRTAVMLHCTGTQREAMHVDRFVGVPCHIAVASDGVSVCHPLNAYLYHGHAANRFAVGIEVSGPGGQYDEYPDVQLEAARIVVRYCNNVLVSRNPLGDAGTLGESPILGPDGMPIREGAPWRPAIMAHRQSHESRVRDPGLVIWREVGQWGRTELGMPLGPVVGSGNEIHEPWLEAA